MKATLHTAIVVPTRKSAPPDSTVYWCAIVISSLQHSETISLDDRHEGRPL